MRGRARGLAATTVVALGALGLVAGCSDPSAPDKVEATFALRAGFQPLEPLTPPGLTPLLVLADTLVFRINGTGERRLVTDFSPRGVTPPPPRRSVSTFTYERAGDTWTIQWMMVCLPDCDPEPAPPSVGTLRDGMLYVSAFGIEFPYLPVD